MNSEDKESLRWTLILMAIVVLILLIAIISSANYRPKTQTESCSVITDRFSRERIFLTCVASSPEKTGSQWVIQCGKQASKLSVYRVCRSEIEDQSPQIIPQNRSTIGARLKYKSGVSYE